MEIQFLTLIKDHNDLMDWLESWFGEDTEGLEEPKEFPCYANCNCIDWSDLDEEGDCKGDALFAPHYLYLDDVKEMLENLES